MSAQHISYQDLTRAQKVSWGNKSEGETPRSTGLVVLQNKQNTQINTGNNGFWGLPRQGPSKRKEVLGACRWDPLQKTETARQFRK